MIEFTLGFGCDVAHRLDQGIRFEVRKSNQEDWEPIRFYTPTLYESDPSTVYLMRDRVFAEAFGFNSTFPYHYVNATTGSELKIKEYLCGDEYSNDGVRLRWMQRYTAPSVENESTWWLDDIKISRWDGTELTTIMENRFDSDTLSSDYAVRAGLVEVPECTSLNNPVLHFRESSEQSVPRRSLVINGLALGCSGGTCRPTASVSGVESDCTVTSCGPDDIQCSLPLLSPVQCSACPPGFATGNDSYDVSCLDVDECEVGAHDCSGLAKCLNTLGSFHCYCPPGYILTSGNTCSDINECEAVHNCSHSCNNTEGSFYCSCPVGYLLENNDTCTLVGVGFDLSSLDVKEGDSVAIEISLRDNITRPLTVKVQTEDISTSPGDYAPLMRETLTFLPGEDATLVLTVDAVSDDFAEVTEQFRVVLMEPSPGLNVTQGSVTVNIIDSTDVLVEFDPVDYIVTEGEEVMFRIVKRTNSTREVTVTVVFDAGNNLTNATTITFAPEEADKFVGMSTLDDDIHERDELFVAMLEGGEGVRLGNSIATASVMDNDVVVIGFESPDLVYVMEGESVTVTVQLTGKTAIDIVVYLTTQDGTANAIKDYTMLNASLTFSSSVSVHNVSIQAMNDNEIEGDEELQLVLSDPAAEGRGNVAIGNTSTVTIVINNVVQVSLPPITIGFELPDYLVGEESVPFPVCVLITDGEEGDPIHVSLTSSDLDAKAGVDYQRVSVDLTLIPGSSPKVCTTITLIDNSDLESSTPKQLLLSLETPPTSSSGQSIITNPSSARVAIFDDEVVLSSVGDLLSLSSSDASDSLSNLVDSLIASGRKVSPVISKQLLQASQDLLNNIDDSSDMGVGGRVLATLDLFALRAYDEKEQPELRVDGLSLRVQEVGSTPSNDSMIVGIDQGGTTITLPLEVLGRAGQTVRIASFIYTNLTSSLPSQSRDVEKSNIGSPVISTALGCGSRGNKCPSDVTSGFNMPVRITLPVKKMDESRDASCQFLNLDDNVWSSGGCSVVEAESTDTAVVCECSHLTHFAILLSPGLNITGAHEVALQIIGYVGVSISLFCMVCTIIALVALKSLWGMRNYIHINLCICLIIAQLIFVIGVDKTENQDACSAIAILLHYFFLASFMWMLMEGVVLYVALVRVFIKKQSLYIAGFTIVSYGAPLLYMVVTVPLGLVLEDGRGNFYGSTQACWLRSDTHFVWAFIVPVILIILTNIGFFIMAVHIMYKHQRRSVHKSAVKKVKHWLKTSIALLFIMGITWIIGVIVFNENLIFVAYIFTVFVAFQGTIIFVMFIVLSKQVRENYRKWWRGKVAESDTLSKYFSSSESGGNRILGRFSTLRTSSFRLSRHRSTFHSSHIDTDIKIPDEKDHEAQRQVISPEMRINEYMMERKQTLGESVVDSSEIQFVAQPNGKVDLGESVVETTDYLASEPNGAAVVSSAVVDSNETRVNGECGVTGVESHVTSNKDEPDVDTGMDEVTMSCAVQDNHDEPEHRHTPSDTQQSAAECRQTTSEEQTTL